MLDDIEPGQRFASPGNACNQNQHLGTAEPSILNNACDRSLGSLKIVATRTRMRKFPDIMIPIDCRCSLDHRRDGEVSRGLPSCGVEWRFPPAPSSLTETQCACQGVGPY